MREGLAARAIALRHNLYFVTPLLRCYWRGGPGVAGHSMTSQHHVYTAILQAFTAPNYRALRHNRRPTGSVSSKGGQDTSFEVLIPASTSPVPESAPTVLVRVPGARNSGTILVVDDEESVRSVVRSVLERAGFDVRVASDGSEAVEVFLHDGAGITGVLLDLTMPRMDGLEAAQKLKSIRAEVPILLMSGYNEQDISRQFSELGVSGFIKKPFSPDALASAVSHILTPVG